MKKLIVGSIAFLLLLVVVSFFTKTTQEEFQQRAMQEWKKHNEKMASNPVMEDVIEVQDEFMTKALEHLVVVDDFGICSLFTLHLPDGDYRYLGVFHQIVPLQKSNPINQFYPSDEK